MPRIDPLQLLKCLGVLLTPSGGIRSNEEVQRLASLMMKFSKKLVSKCVYILILKNTEPHLLGLFMSAGGWTLVLTWLSDGISGKNWALVTELLELLLMCPVDVERLKSNSIPRLVKGLSKDESLGQVNILASRLVEQWLKIVKDETVSPEVTSTVVIVNQENIVLEEIPQDNVTPGLVEEITLKVNEAALDDGSSQVVVTPQQFYKVTVRDGKQVIAKVDSVVNSDNSAIERTEQSSDNMTLSGDNNVTVNHVEAHTEITEQIIKDKKEVDKKSSSSNNKEKDREKSRHDRSSSKHRSSSSKSSSSSSSKSSSRDKHSNSTSSSSSSRDKNKDKDRDRNKDRDKHKHRSNGSVKNSSNSNSSNNSGSSSSTNKDNKEKQAEKDKDTLAKIQPKSVDKLGRIPKKSSSSSSSDKKSDKKSSDSSSSSSEHRSKPSISIEVRKKESGDRPKTVKVFNSKLRSTGLEEAPKPPPPRTTPKKPTTLPSIPVKRPSPSREAPPPPEKRIKLPDTEIEKPGGIKLIPPKPKPAFLQESNMFMDALASSATNKKEPKKRKRRTSVSKDAPTTPTTTSPPSSPSVATPSPLNSPLALKNIAAPKFYKETLDTEEPKPAAEEETTTAAATVEPQQPQAKPKESEDTSNEIKSPDQVEEDDGPTENVVKEVNGVRGVLVYHKRKGPKKSVKWRQETELEEIQYFELDETERVNVTKTFMDMKQMEHTGEREALQLSRKLPNEDLMDERITWKALVPLDLPAALAEPGKKSLEKDIQFAREKVILQALYFNRSMLPDSAAEPDPETHQMTDPVTIPLDDVTGNPDSINDFQGTPWPEPKGSPPHPGPIAGPPSLFTGIPPFTPPIVGPPGGVGGVPGGFPNIPPQNFNGPNFMPPPHLMGAGDWRPMGEGPMPTDNNHPGPIAPLFNNRQDNFNDAPPVGFPPQGFGPPGPMGPPGPGPGPGPMFPNFPNNRGGNRGGFRNMGRGGWFRPAGPPPGWHGNRGGGGNHWAGRGGGGGICKQFKMHGYCRQRDTCPYMHPQGNAHNGPY